ncbi:hypothetical protein J2T12_005123 [Paenibacillus anaericanus]|uniref:DUF6932 family protein n=1 Tax=Paenibacillus anaericanus TaxID=170367 RepID=UPI0027861F97|nr:hypothetical protein [Paenibacillus anaericanus]MDQ0091683.1 hypothetical protein [Paenibacillus anaericanus]
MNRYFLPDGNLFPGIHEYNWQEFEKQFVLDFVESTKRSLIFENFKTWIGLLIDILPPRYIWLDGSYLTQKTDPNDMDIVAFYYPEDIENEEVYSNLNYIIHEVSRKHNCDAYFSLSFDKFSQEEKAKLPNNYAIMQTYWMGQFGYDRSRNAKGMAVFSKEELLLLKREVPS